MRLRVAWTVLAAIMAISLFLPWGFEVEGAYFNRAVGASGGVFLAAGDADAWHGSWWLATVLAVAAVSGAATALRPGLRRPAALLVAAAAATAVVYFIADGGGVRWGALVAVGSAGALAACLAATPR